MLRRGSEGGRVDIYRIVPPASADAEVGRISAESPLGAAMLGLAAGETAEFEVAGIRKTVVVLRILPDAD
jgi:transcription elongation GreA/GreB family factor